MIGSTIGGYQLVRELGDGGQGSVWEAQRVADGQRVALKVIHGHIRHELGERIRQEASLLGSINDPGLPRLVELVQEGAVPVALAMELVDGVPVGAAFEAEKLSQDQSREFLTELARILAVLHGRGIVHRDVKPGNVLLRSSWRTSLRGAVVLVDLSIAKERAARTKTEPGLVMGTPAFLAPEFLLGQRGSIEATPTADVFGWGVIAWMTLFGQHPTGLSVESDPIEFMRAYSVGAQKWIRPSATDALAHAGPNAGIVTCAIRALRDDPSTRPQNGSELLTTIGQWGAPTGVAGLGRPGQHTALKVDTWKSFSGEQSAPDPAAVAEPARVSAPSVPSFPGSSSPTVTSSRTSTKRGGFPIAAAIAAVVVVVMIGIGVGGFLLLGGGADALQPGEPKNTAAVQPTPPPNPPAPVSIDTPEPVPEPTSEPTPTPEPAPTPAGVIAKAPFAAATTDVRIAVTVVVDSSKSGGAPWDVGSGPDPRIGVSTSSGGSSASFRDQFSAKANFKLKLKYGDTVNFSAYDQDVAFDDYIGTFSTKYRGPGTSAKGRGGAATFTVVFSR